MLCNISMTLNSSPPFLFIVNVEITGMYYNSQLVSIELKIQPRTSFILGNLPTEL